MAAVTIADQVAWGRVRSSAPLSRAIPVTVLLAGHMVAPLLFDDHPMLGILHAYGTLVLALGMVLLGRRAERAAFAAAYFVGSEVLWRMSNVAVYWEFAKYAIVLILAIALARFFPRKRRLLAPTLFLFVLLPSTVLALNLGSLDRVRDAVSFNLSGPLSLVVCVMFFRQLKMSGVDARVLLWALVVPIAGVSARTLDSILTADQIVFTTESNLVASGGFGPNQVSAILGLGALCAAFLVVRESHPWLKVVAGGLFFWFMTQSFLTFSRGGVYNLVLAGAVSALLYGRARGRRISTMAFIVFTVLVLGWLVLPRLEEFTERRLQVRFTSLDTTQRVSLASSELAIWADSPLTGVGPGGITSARERTSELGGIAAHTEFTRLLAEHGFGGVVAIVLLAIMGVSAFRRSPRSSWPWVSAFLVWTVVEMSHSAMRISAVGFSFGLAMLTLVREGRAEVSRIGSSPTRTPFGS